MRIRRFLSAISMLVLPTVVACADAGADPRADAHALFADAEAPDREPIVDAGVTSDAARPDARTPDAATAVADATPPDATPPADAGPAPVVVLSEATTTSTIAGHTGYPGSVMVTDLCPAGHVVTGASGHSRGSADGYNGPIQLICRPIGAAAGPPILVGLGDPAVYLPLRGAELANDVIWTRECPANQVLIGFQGRAGAIIDQLALRCATLTPSATDAHALVVGPPAGLPPVGGVGGAAMGPFDCASGGIARGAVIYHSGDPGYGLGMQFLDGLAVVCSTAVLQ